MTAGVATRSHAGGWLGRLGPDLVRDAAVMAVVSAALCLFSRHLLLMTAIVALAWLGRMAAWVRLHGGGRALLVEIAFMAVCTALGALNDWLTVVVYGVYAYAVPHELGPAGALPVWMMLFWGLILRFLATLAAWKGLGGGSTTGRVTRPAARIAAMLVLVLATRQCIYRLYEHPVWSWLPFLLALMVYAGLLGIGPRERRLAALMLVGGPAVEVLYIQVGGLHHYALGWLAGVPIWIALWWVLGIWVWAELAVRIRAAMASLVGFPPAGDGVPSGRIFTRRQPAPPPG